MKIQNKILLSLAVPAIFVVLFVVIVYTDLRKINKEVTFDQTTYEYMLELETLRTDMQKLIDEILRFSLHGLENTQLRSAMDSHFTAIRAQKDKVLTGDLTAEQRKTLEESLAMLAVVESLVVDQLIPAVEYGANRTILVNVNDLIDLALSDNINMVAEVVSYFQSVSDKTVLRIENLFTAVRFKVTMNGIFIIFLFITTILVVQFSVIKKLKGFISTVDGFVSGDGDLTKRIPVDSKDEFGELALLFNEFTESVQNVVREVWVSAATVVNENVTLTETVSDIKHVISAQTSSIHDIADDIEKIANSSGVVAKDIEGSATSLVRIISDVETGGKKLSETKNDIDIIKEHTKKLSDTIRVLTSESNKIGEMLTSINGIANQTNLLALNAAIEAARAGEAGKGFAVVAGEVRKLAEGTQSTVKEIEKIVGNLNSITQRASLDMDDEIASVEAGEGIIEETETAFKLIVDGVADIGKLTGSVQTVVSAQSAELAGLNKDMVSLTLELEKGEKAINGLEESVGSLKVRAEALKALVGKFKT